MEEEEKMRHETFSVQTVKFRVHLEQELHNSMMVVNAL